MGLCRSETHPPGLLLRRRPVVLVVEDDSVLREYYRIGLSERFVVELCADGMSAREYFDRRPPDVVVLDLDLPRLHGCTLYNELRRQPLTEGIPIVVVTGIDPVPAMWGVPVLRKPCSIEAVIDALERALTGGAPTGGL